MITFYLTDKDRERSTIYLLVSFRGKRYTRTTGESTLVKLWNPKKKRVKVLAGDLISNTTNEVLDKLTTASNEAIAHFKDHYNPPLKEEFFSIVDRLYYKDVDKKDSVYLTDYMEMYIERYRDSKSSSCVKKYITTMNKLVEYETTKKRRLLFSDIDINFYHDFRKWFFSQKFSTNYFGNTIKTLKQIYHEAQFIDNLHDCNLIKHKDFVGTREDTDSVYLNTNELQLIFELEFTIDSIMEFYLMMNIKLDREQARKKVQCYNLIRDRFLIGAYTGLRVSDFGRLSDANIQGDFIKLRAKKTDKETVIPMNSKVKIMVDRNDLSVTVSDQKINKHIKEICNIAGITDEVLIHRSEGGKRVEYTFKKYELISTHTARRSFATNAYKAGIPTIAIMKITGHSKEAVFLKYIKVAAEENAETLLLHPFFK